MADQPKAKWSEAFYGCGCCRYGWVARVGPYTLRADTDNYQDGERACIALIALNEPVTDPHTCEQAHQAARVWEYRTERPCDVQALMVRAEDELRARLENAAFSMRGDGLLPALPALPAPTSHALQLSTPLVEIRVGPGKVDAKLVAAAIALALPFEPPTLQPVSRLRVDHISAEHWGAGLVKFSVQAIAPAADFDRVDRGSRDSFEALRLDVQKALRTLFAVTPAGSGPVTIDCLEEASRAGLGMAGSTLQDACMPLPRSLSPVPEWAAGLDPHQALSQLVAVARYATDSVLHDCLGCGLRLSVPAGTAALTCWCGASARSLDLRCHASR